MTEPRSLTNNGNASAAVAGCEKTLWQAADNLDAAECEDVVDLIGAPDGWKTRRLSGGARRIAPPRRVP
jgi:hypothetical protein